jgi:peptidyl-prolyl cis-trans isomerase C
VNGVAITRQALEAELSRLAASAGREATNEDRQRVLDSLIDGSLLAQAAEEEGFQMDDAQLQARVEALQAGMGGPEQFKTWMAAQGYDEASFRSDLAQASAAAWMRDRIMAAVPATAEQVHARQVLAGSRQEADEVVARLQAGENFARLAEEYDPVAGGELGWFPRGYLIDPSLDKAIFALQPGEWAGPLETTLGFHLIQVIERETERPLDPDALRVAQETALGEWLAARRSSAQIEVLEP